MWSTYLQPLSYHPRLRSMDKSTKPQVSVFDACPKRARHVSDMPKYVSNFYVIFFAWTYCVHSRTHWEQSWDTLGGYNTFLKLGPKTKFPWIFSSWTLKLPFDVYHHNVNTISGVYLNKIETRFLIFHMNSSDTSRKQSPFFIRHIDNVFMLGFSRNNMFVCPCRVCIHVY